MLTPSCFLQPTVPVVCSFVEESNADKAIKALTSALAPKAKVIRDGETKGIEAIDLVPGTPPCLPFSALAAMSPG